MRSRATSLWRTGRSDRATILLRLRRLTIIEAAIPELPDLNAPEFAPIKARFARANLEHKADLGVPNASDEAVLARVDDITALMLGALGRAMAERRHTWLRHYGWCTDPVIELLDDQPGKSLHG
jgi:hypothetical protein